MVKVCHITSVHQWNDTRIFYKECVSLARAGYEVTMIAPGAPEQVTDGVKVVGVERSAGRMKRATVVAWRVMRAAFRTKASVVHFHDPELIWVGLILRMGGRKVIFDIHENIRAQILVKEWLPARRLIARIFGFFDWVAAKCFYLVLAETSYETIYSRISKDVVTVLNMPDVARLQPVVEPFSQRPPGILYIGVVSRERGIFEIVKALSLLSERGVDFYFHCIGPVEPGIEDQLENEEAFARVKDHMKIYGTIPVYEAYKLADLSRLGISLLHPIDNYLHSFSTKIFEYMAVGLPFVVSNFELYRFVEDEQTGLTANPLDPASIATQLERLLTDEDLSEQLAANGKRVVREKYSWAAQESKLLDLYARVTKTGPQS